MATAVEYATCAVEVSVRGRTVLRWQCPACGRLVKLGESDGFNCDRGGWHGTLGPRWPRHYSWAHGMK